MDDLRLVIAVKEAVPLLIDDLALRVRDVIELDEVLSDVEVPGLDLALRVLNGAGDHAVLDGVALLHADPLEEALHLLSVDKALHQAVVEGDVEAG